MSSDFRQVLGHIRNESGDDTTQLGTSFESLTKIFLENDPIQQQEYGKVWRYETWAKGRKGYAKKDIGIDLVAELRDGSGFCAIQSKCYSESHQVSKQDLDSFISASSTSDFPRLLLVDTSILELGRNAQQVIKKLDKEFLRVQTVDLEESPVDWLAYLETKKVKTKQKKTLRDDQLAVFDTVREKFKSHDRGKMIMACGTGKTFTSLRIAEDIAGPGKHVLYMVPSLALMAQTVREWKYDAAKDFTAFSACSDIKVGKKQLKNDVVQLSLSDLAFPATTDSQKLATQISEADPTKMTVVFSTYQSIDVISKAQYDFGAPEFDLIICDEAHRTTGATLTDEDESHFVKIHDNENVKGQKRLYMTATPRIFGDKARQRADEGEVTLASMDDEDVFGPLFFHRGFGWAVENNLLTDYKVIVLAVDEGIVSQNAQRSLRDGDELNLDDATKIVGCYKALAKIGITEGDDDQEIKKSKPMRRALAFCQNIDSSKMVADQFATVVSEYSANERIAPKYKTDLQVDLQHVDGTFNAEQRGERLSWLKGDLEENRCHVLTNARCLSEGVDVPSLDAIMFLHPRKSQIDVVQSVGRVMRKAEGKDLGYVILPIAVPSGVSPELALNANERYEVVWQILNALRAHDERFDSTINKIGLGENVSEHLEILGVGNQDELEATTAVVEDIKTKPEPKEEPDENTIGEDEDEGTEEKPEQMSFILADLSSAIKAKIVDKCGTRDYWETWAKDIAKIARQHITQIETILLEPDTEERKAFDRFLAELRDDLNPEISHHDAVEMLSQHLITQPVFEALFAGNSFKSDNPVSQAMEGILDRLHEQQIDTETRTLEKFYKSVRRRADGIQTSAGRQTLIVELYNKFFSSAFPKLSQRLGIVYTPPEVVDFILHSVNDALESEFGKSLGSPGVHILDPFTGTGTFITRLIDSGLISRNDLKRKFESEMHANEIVLLAYYIATINIESAYQDIVKEKEYTPFEGAVFTDTFHLFEQERDMIADLLPDNSERRTKQKERDLTVIVANPPYSSGQASANDNAQNVAYPNLDKRIEETYAAGTKATLKNHLYDSYIRAVRWASDRVGEEGVIGFVTNAGWIDGSAFDGLRKCFEEEFSKIFIFHLRGNARTQGELRQKEKGNIFGEGSRAPIAITILVKNKKHKGKAEILFCDIGDYLDQKQKLSKIESYKSINGLLADKQFKKIKPDDENDWINQGDKTYRKYIPVGDKKDKSALSIFMNFSNGIKTNRDAFNYNFLQSKVLTNVKSSILFYNSEVERYKKSGKQVSAKDFVTVDPKKISWDRTEREGVERGRNIQFEEDSIQQSVYRPFTKMWLYADRRFNNCIYQMPQLFPGAGVANLAISVSGVGARAFSCLMVNTIPCFDMVEKGQCMPIHLYESHAESRNLAIDQSAGAEYSQLGGISQAGFDHFKKAYPKSKFSKEDLFYYIYGLLHSPHYRDRFQNNLSKELPRIPAVKSFEDFKKFSDTGRLLGELHVNYESVKPYEVNLKQGDLRLADTSDPISFYRVEKMKLPNKKDKSVVYYNSNITMEGIPLEAWDYVVNSKPALQWVMERQCVTTDKKTGIVNDANDYANETMNDPAYPYDLFRRVITVSLETMKIVKSLPKLKI